MTTLPTARRRLDRLSPQPARPGWTTLQAWREANSAAPDDLERRLEIMGVDAIEAARIRRTWQDVADTMAMFE